MDVLVYSALNEQSSLKKQVAAKQKELFDLKANQGSGEAAGDPDDMAKSWLSGSDSVEKYLQICPEDTDKWACIYGGADWTGELLVRNNDGYYRCGCQCTWTVPSGATKARFQLWGAGGGANHPGRCCGYTLFGSTGAYLSVIIPVSSGNQFSICSGCAYCCWAESWSGAQRLRGCPSYVTGPGLCYLCAEGGDGGHGMYHGMRLGKQNPCYAPCLNNPGANMDFRTCYYGSSMCRNSGQTGGFFDYVAGAGYYGTTAVSNPTAENIIYGIRGIWNKWCIHDNTYGCFHAAPVYGFETSSKCVQSFDSNTCCGGGWRAQNGYLQIPGAGGWMSHAMGGCVSFCGDQGRFGMVCVQYQ